MPVDPRAVLKFVRVCRQQLAGRPPQVLPVNRQAFRRYDAELDDPTRGKGFKLRRSKAVETTGRASFVRLLDSPPEDGSADAQLLYCPTLKITAYAASSLG
jgi:hypothetical protein